MCPRVRRHVPLAWISDWPVGSWLKLALVGSIAQIGSFWDVSRRCTCSRTQIPHLEKIILKTSLEPLLIPP